MHWADKIAEKLIQVRPETDTYVCAAGISPSGPVHIGNFRDVATSYFVARGLQDRGRNFRLLFSWDDFDRFRKVPLGVPEDWEQHLGKPLSAVPDPWGEDPSYAAHFEKRFQRSMEEMGIDLEYRYQTREYQSGKYCKLIQLALQHRREIYDILAQFRTQKPSDEEREAYYPIAIYDDETGKDDTTVVSLAADAKSLVYRGSNGEEKELDLTRGGTYKLPWKIDWPMRWRYEGVDFEPGGKDHSTVGGSYYVSRIISKEIFDYLAPLFEGYEFIGITGATSKMSGSTGTLYEPRDLLKVYQPEILKWLFAKVAPRKAFNISLNEEIYRQYDEFDRAVAAAREGTANEANKRSLELCRVEGRQVHSVPFRQLASFSNIYHGNTKAMEEMFERLGTPFTEDQFAERLAKAEHWLRTYSPESAITVNEEPNRDYYNTLSGEEKQWVASLHRELSHLSDRIDEQYDELTSMLYAIPKQEGLEEAETKKRQRRFFEIVYMLLINRDTGPRLATFIQALGTDRVLPLLEF